VPSWVAPAVALASISWGALLVAAPLLSVPAAGVLYAIGSFICHQIPERSFYVAGFQLPVCARCLGLYVGGALGSVVAVFVVRRRTARHTFAVHARPPYMATAMAAAPTMATVVIEWGMGWPLSNLARALAAVPLAAMVAVVVMRAAATLHYDECAPRRPIGHGQPPANT
jgi:hypothetical protein